jgi:magnesium transporter
MIRTLFINSRKQKTTGLSTADLKTALSDPDGLVWISLESPTESEALSILKDLFEFHPLAIEDCLNTGYQTPKVDDFGSYLFIIVHAIHSNDVENYIGTYEFNLFIGANYLVTLIQEANVPLLNDVWKRAERDERMLTHGTDFLAYGILDSIVDDYMPLLDQMDDDLEQLEDRVLDKPEPKLLDRLIDLKHHLIGLRRIISPQREVMNRLSRDEFPMIDRQSQIYFRDIYDHLVRYQDLIETLRDIVGGALDIYLNSTSLRMNEIMKALTIVSTIFLPLSFVAGVYGMNFDFMPELHSPAAYPIVWGVFIAIVTGMLLYFKRRGWF